MAKEIKLPISVDTEAIRGLNEQLTKTKALMSTISDEAELAKLKQQIQETEKSIKDFNSGISTTSLKFEEIYGELQPLSSRLGEVEDRMYELALAGKANTDEFKRLQEEAVKFKQTIIQVDSATDLFAENKGFGKYATAASGALGSIVAGFSAYQGALGLIGVESESVEKTLLKVQSAMALSQGLSELSKTKESFKDLATVLTSTATGQKVLTATQIAGATAMKALNAVMNANPVFLIIGGITALAGAIKYFSSQTESAEEANERLNKSLERTSALYDDLAKFSKLRNDNALALLQAEGASEKELHLKKLDNMAIEKNYRDGQIEIEKATISKKTAAYKKALSEENWELAKTIQSEIKASQAKYKELQFQNTNYYSQIQIERAQFATDEKTKQDEANKEADAKRKENNEKGKQAKKEALNQIAEAEKMYRLSQMDEKDREIKEVDDRYTLLINKAKKYGKDTQLLIEAQKNAVKDINIKYAQAEDKAKEEKDAKEKEKNAKEKEELDKKRLLSAELQAVDLQSTLGYLEVKRQIEVSQAGLTAEEIDLINKKAKEDKEKLIGDAKKAQEEADDKSIEDAKKVAEERRKTAFSAAQAGAEALNLIATIAENNAKDDLARQKKAFNVRKMANIAQATIDGTKAVLSTFADTPGGPVIKGVAAAIAGGFALAQIAKIATSKFEGGSSPSTTGPSTSNVSTSTSTSGPATPSFSLFGSAGQGNNVNQDQNNNNPTQNITVTAVVSETEITTTQNKIKNIKTNSEL